MQEIQLERLRYPEIGALLEAGWTTAVFACGATEQHGPHLPLCVDAEHGTALALEIARQLGHTLVAPTIRIGCSDHHLAFPGSLSIRKETFENIVHDYIHSLRVHGFRQILIVPTHGGNYLPLEEMKPRLKAAFPDIRLAVYHQLSGLLELWRDQTQAYNGMGDRVGGHADIAETSFMLFLHPELVRMDLAEAGFMGHFSEEVIRDMIEKGFRTVTPNGILGDAHGADPLLGKRLIHALAEQIVTWYRETDDAQTL
jgi:creatinine amidohydrolase